MMDRMAAIVDHVFICTEPGAPVAESLCRFGLTEGPPNRHPGQGTACRRFFFENAMLELLWLADPAEAASPQARPTRLLERCLGGPGVCPFGIILRPEVDGEPCPFESWEYRPQTMPDLVLRVASRPALDEPMWCYLEHPYDRRPSPVHQLEIRRLTGLILQGPTPPESSVTAAMASLGILHLEPAPAPLMTLCFAATRACRRHDFRPALALELRY
jgi:hypothetical protein